MIPRRDGHQEAVEDTLRARLSEAEEMLRAIRQGEVDALVVEDAGGNRVYTLHSADEPYRDLVEQMQEGAVVLSRSGDILYANARFAALVGEPLESVVGGRIGRFVDAADRDDFETLLRAGNGRHRARLIGSASGSFEASVSLTVTASPQGDRLNLIVTDLTQLLEANSNLERAARENRTKDEFLAMLAHELRNPLSAIGNAVRALELTQGRSEPMSAAHRVIARQVAHISHIITDLLDVERVVSGKIRLNRQPLDMADAVRRAVATVTAGTVLDRHVTISTEPLWIEGDAVRIEQVLTNLVTNAIKYTPAGGQIRVTLRAEGADAVLSVEDNGFGISKELMPLVFGLYVQSPQTLERAEGGLGIGLTLVRRLVELHGGTIEGSSAGEGLGSTFTVRLAQSAHVGNSPILPVRADRVVAKPRRVLLIEDSADAREMLRLVLELAGHEVYEAADGVRGLELLNVVLPDVGIIDIRLPAMNGYQVARRIREDEHGRGMLLVALSGQDQLDADPSADRVFDRHLVKPVDPDQLMRLLNESA